VTVEADGGTEDDFSDLIDADVSAQEAPDLAQGTETAAGREMDPAQDGKQPKTQKQEQPKGTETHRVSYAFSRLRGCITVSIDGDSFALPAGFLGLRAARRERFRLGAEQAVLAVDRGGHASLILRGDTLPPEAD
jgi:hypothetical protein